MSNKQSIKSKPADGIGVALKSTPSATEPLILITLSLFPLRFFQFYDLVFSYLRRFDLLFIIEVYVGDDSIDSLSPLFPVLATHESDVLS